MTFPPIPQHLLEALEERFPERSPEPSETHAALMVRAGEANVVRFLRNTFTEQTESVPSVL